MKLRSLSKFSLLFLLISLFILGFNLWLAEMLSFDREIIYDATVFSVLFVFVLQLITLYKKQFEIYFFFLKKRFKNRSEGELENLVADLKNNRENTDFKVQINGNEKTYCFRNKGNRFFLSHSKDGKLLLTVRPVFLKIYGFKADVKEALKPVYKCLNLDF